MADAPLRIHSGAPWEAEAGYCRAVRRGRVIAVSGTTAVGDDGEIVGEGDAYAQARRCMEIIEAALGRAGAGLADVVRTRMYVTDISHWRSVARAHAEVFGDHPPATSLLAVSGLIDPRMLVEIEADAVVGTHEDQDQGHHIP